MVVIVVVVVMVVVVVVVVVVIDGIYHVTTGGSLDGRRGGSHGK